jgi:hypothetical protein
MKGLKEENINIIEYLKRALTCKEYDASTTLVADTRAWLIT